MIRHPCSSPTRALLAAYLEAKFAVVEAGFESEIAWQELQSLDHVTECALLREAAWVVLSSGMRETVVRGLFGQIGTAFGDWRSARWIAQHSTACRKAALRVFRHQGKIDALLHIASDLHSTGVENVLDALRSQGADALLDWPYMGPATSRHLAKNLGVNVAKPDRHLVRTARALGYSSASELCECIAEVVGDAVAVVDLVIWRHATLVPWHENLFVKAATRDSRDRSSASMPGRRHRAKLLPANT